MQVAVMLIFLAVWLLILWIGSIAFESTGLSRSKARFQALSALTAELRTRPTMTLAQMRSWLQTTHHLTVSTATIDRALHRIGWRFRSLR